MTDVKLTPWEWIKCRLFGFHVVCDDRNNTEQDVEEGRVNVNVVMIHTPSKKMPGVLSDYLEKPSPLGDKKD